MGGDGDWWRLFWSKIRWAIIESEREGRQSGPKERDMGDTVVFWECFSVGREGGDGH
jgi:hypothetical protein